MSSSAPCGCDEAFRLRLENRALRRKARHLGLLVAFYRLFNLPSSLKGRRWLKAIRRVEARLGPNWRMRA